jgi:hypothetical protein
MQKQNSKEPVESSAVCYATLEQWAREQFKRSSSTFWRKR